MKAVFFGTPKLGAAVLKALIDSRHEILCVVTGPDKKTGRGRAVRFSPVKETALAAKLPLLQPESVTEPEFLDKLEVLDADIHIVAAYSKKLPPRLLNMARYNCVNVHPSLLPKYRGCAPQIAPIYYGDNETGVTIMKMAEKMDTGDILAQSSFPLSGTETAAALEEKLAALGASLLLETLDGLEKGTVMARPQDDSKSSYVKMLSKDSGLMDFNMSAAALERMCRAFDPWPSAYAFLNGKTFKIWKARVYSNEEYKKLFNCGKSFQNADPGTVIYSDKKGFGIITGDGVLSPEEVQLEGKKKMGAEEFLRGFRLLAGTRLTGKENA